MKCIVCNTGFLMNLKGKRIKFWQIGFDSEDLKTLELNKKSYRSIPICAVNILLHEYFVYIFSVQLQHISFYKPIPTDWWRHLGWVGKRW